MLGAFDLLKNMGVDMTTFAVPCLIQKLIMVLDKIGKSCQNGRPELRALSGRATKIRPARYGLSGRPGF
jgi:hypothetical protein